MPKIANTDALNILHGVMYSAVNIEMLSTEELLKVSQPSKTQWKDNYSTQLTMKCPQ